MKTNALSTPFIAKTAETKRQTVNFGSSDFLSSDSFIKSKNTELKDLKLKLAEKLINLYEKNGEKSYSHRIYVTLNSLSTKKEISFIEKLIKKNLDTETIECTAFEIGTFNEKYNRSMTDEEHKIFADFIPAIKYRAQNDFSYKGSFVYQLISKAKNPNDRKDMISLLQSPFRLYDVEIRNGFLDETENLKPENNISKLLKYKKENPEIASVIIPTVTAHIGNYNFNQVRNFFELYKKSGQSELLLDFTKNKNLTFFEIEELFEILNEVPEIKQTIEPHLKEDTANFIKFLTETLKEYPELAKNIAFLNKIPTQFIEEKKESFVDKILSCLKGNSFGLAIEYPGANRSNEILKPNQKIDWKKVTQNAENFEELKKITATINEALNTLTRMDSRKYKNEDKWAIKNKIIIDIATHMIKNDRNFESVLNTIAKGYGGSFDKGIKPRGQIRTNKEDKTMVTLYNPTAYSEYAKKFYEYHKKFPNRISPFENMELTQLNAIDKTCGIMQHPKKEFIIPALKHANESYNKIVDALKEQKCLTPETKKEIAKIHFIITNALPFSRGTAGIANLLTRSLYKAFGIVLPATRENVSLDLEAFCNSLEEYQKNWKNYFE